MKIKIIKIGKDLEEKDLIVCEVENSICANEKIKNYAEDNKLWGLWIENKPLGFIKTKEFNIGAKIL